MVTQNFYKLGRPVQDRLIGCINGTGLPAPILSARGGPVEPFLWLLGAGAGLVGVLVLYRLGLGALDSGLAIQSPAVLAGYFLLLGGAAYALLHAGALFFDARSLPFKPGVYLFAIGIIDARRHTLKIHSIDDMIAFDGPLQGTNAFKVSFKSGTFEFRAKNAEDAAKAVESMGSSKSRIAEAEEAPGSMRPRAMAALDPLQGFVNPLAPTTSIERNVPPWAKFSFAIAPALGLLLGVLVWLVRNVASDDKMFARAQALGDATSYREYLARGSRHRGEVEVVLLPRAELKEAQQIGGVDAIEAYIKAHPKTGIAPEIDKALKAAMLAELEEAKKAGTVTALKAFATKHPTHGLGPELKAATHAVYADALDKYKSNDAPKDPGVVGFVEKLVAWVEARGPKVELRFRRRAPRTLEKAEAAIGKSRYFMGTMSFPARYMDAQHMKPREEDLAKAVLARFGDAFPADVLTMEVGEPVADPDAPLPPVTVPTWFVEYEPEWDGGLRTSDRPRGVFVGVGYMFIGTFKIPDDAGKPLLFKPNVIWRAPRLDGLDPDAHPEERLYADMTQGAFEQFGKKLIGQVFATK
jgi:hypothetical protein